MKWKFILTDAIADSAPVTLKNDPMGWDVVKIQLLRDDNYRGLFASMIEKLEFIEDGYSFLQDMYNLYGSQADVTIQIYAAGDDTSAFSLFFTGKVGFDTIVFSQGSVCKAGTDIQPFGPQMTFRNRADQKVDLSSKVSFGGQIMPLYKGLGFESQMQPKAIQLSSNGADVAPADPSFGSNIALKYTDAHVVLAGTPGTTRVVNSTVYYWGNYQLLLNTLASNYAQDLDGIIQVTKGRSTNLSDVPTILTVVEEGNYTFSFDDHFKHGDNEVELKASTSAGLAGCSGGTLTDAFSEYQVQLIAEINGTDNIIWDSTDVTGGCFTDQLVNINDDGGGFPTSFAPRSWTVALTAGETFRFYIRVFMQGTYHTDISDQPLNFNTDLQDFKIGISISVLTYVAPSECKQFLINEIFSRVSESITDGQLRVKSDYFGRTDSAPYVSDADGPGSLECLTTGLFIRQALMKDSQDPGNYIIQPKLQLSFNDAFNNGNCIHNIGLGLEADTDRQGQYQRIRIEPVEYFYDKSTIIFVADKVYDIERQPDLSEAVNTVKIGYDTFNAEKYTGLDEFNSPREYRTQLRQNSNLKDLTCKFVASGYCIEVTRQLLFVVNINQDWRLDNNIFITCMKRATESGGHWYAPNSNTGFTPQLPDSEIIHLIIEQGDGSADYPAYLTMSPSNLIDPPTVYNMRISPLRNLLRWCKSLLGFYTPSQLLDDGFIAMAFSGATGNFTSIGAVSNDYIAWPEVPKENINIDTAIIKDAYPQLLPITKAEKVTISNYPMSLKEFNAVEAHPTGVIKFRVGQNTAWEYGFIDTLEYDPNRGECKLILKPEW